MVLAKGLGGPAFLVAAIRNLAGVSQLLSILWVGLLEGRRRLPFMVAAVAVGRGVLLLYLLFPILPALGQRALPWAFFGVAAVGYLLAAGAVPARTAIIDLLYPGTHRGRIWGFFQSARVPFFMGAAYAAGLVLDRDVEGHSTSWRIVFPAAGAIGLLAAAVLSRLPVGRWDRPAPGEAGFSAGAALGILRNDREFRNYMIAFSIFGFANLLQSPAQVYYLKDEFGIDYRRTSIVFGVIPQVCMFATGALWGRFFDRVSLYFARSLFNAIWSIQPLLWAVAPSMGWVYAGAVVEGLAEAGSGLTWSLGILYFAPKERIPLYMSVHLFLTGLRALVAPQVGQLLMGPLGYRGVFWVTFGLMLIASGMMLALGRIEREERRAAPLPPPEP